MAKPTTTLQLLGAASCWGAQDKRCELGPDALKAYGLAEKLKQKDVDSEWRAILRPDASARTQTHIVHKLCTELASHTRQMTNNNNHFVVFGGDHSCAIGTWSGVSAAVGDHQKLGLIWIDAHMDSHLPETTPSGAVHGMPLACLLGHGEKPLREICVKRQKLLPQNVCLIGVRSYEDEEAALLRLLGVRVFHMQDLSAQGLNTVWQAAIEHVKRNTERYGITIDLDAIDPTQAPGVGSPESGGIDAIELMHALEGLGRDSAFVGAEITEYNPTRDENLKTADITLGLVEAMFK